MEFINFKTIYIEQLLEFESINKDKIGYVLVSKEEYQQVMREYCNLLKDTTKPSILITETGIDGWEAIITNLITKNTIYFRTYIVNNNRKTIKQKFKLPLETEICQ